MAASEPGQGQREEFPVRWVTLPPRVHVGTDTSRRQLMGRRTHEGIRTDRSVVSKKEHEGGGRGVGGGTGSPVSAPGMAKVMFRAQDVHGNALAIT